MLLLIVLGKVGAQASRSEVESNGGDSEETEACNLSAHTDKTKCFAKIKLALCIGISGVCAGDENCSDKLEEERGDIEANKEKGDKSSYVVKY
jgi:hypothetical protein